MTTNFENALKDAQNDTTPRPDSEDIYRGRWQRFENWCEARKGEAASETEAKRYEYYPPSVPLIGAYIRSMEAEGLKAGTLQGAFTAIAWQVECFTEVPEEDRPESLKGFTETGSPMPKARKILKKVIGNMNQTPAKRARGITVEELAQIFRNDKKQRDYGSRTETREEARKRMKKDKALFLTMFYALLRSSEAVNLRWSDIKILSDGWGKLHVRKSKTSSKRRTHIRELSLEVIEALNALLQLAQSREGFDSEDYIFTERSGKHITRRTVSTRIKAAARHAGIKGWDEFSSHSFRAGCAQHLFNNLNVSVEKIAVVGDWASHEVVLSYVANSSKKHNVMRMYMTDPIEKAA